MARRPDARALLFERIRTSPAKFVRVCGVPYTVAIEPASDPTRLDHVWLTLEVPPFGRLQVVINTLSRLNRDAGFDPRIRLGIVRSTWLEKPVTGLEEVPGLDYAKLESAHNIFYETHERDPLAALLLVKLRAAIRVEIWGELYARNHLGIHQIHSRRASCAVAADIINRDGALKLYYSVGNVAELLLLKFCGQL